MTTPEPLADYNRKFYDQLWDHAHVIDASHFNTWPLVQRLLPECPVRLEIGPGLRPRLPLEGTEFVDLSEAAVRKLRAAGGRAVVGSATALPAADATYDLVCALDIIEHVADPAVALREITRVIRPGGRLLLSVPLHPGRWTSFDRTVGHSRRFEPAELVDLLSAHAVTIESSAVYGMQPQSSLLLDFAMGCLDRHRRLSMWFYSHLFMPWALRWQSDLEFALDFSETATADEVLIVGRKSPAEVLK
ncbi:MAG TPA: class I SAM-dependent methyltransferase [Chthoniobacterales bacterium]